MSRWPFALTLLISGTLVGWLYLKPDAQSRPKRAAADGRSIVQLFGFPDPRGIILEMHESPFRSCPGSRFRNESPAFAAWDDGTVVYRTSTFDYRRSQVSFDKVQEWARTFRAYSIQNMVVACGKDSASPAWGERISLRGIGWGLGSTISVARLSPSHADECDDCVPLRPLARMLQDMDGLIRDRAGELIDGLPVEVYLEFRSCGCRNHPEIADVSKEWPLSGPRPRELCRGGSRRIRLEDPAEIRALSSAIERSAAVLDREEIYTCFMRPVLQVPRERTLARR